MEELEELDAHIAILKEGLRAKQPPLKVIIVTVVIIIVAIIVTIIVTTLIIIVIVIISLILSDISIIQVAETRLAQRTHRPGELKLFLYIFMNIN